MQRTRKTALAAASMIVVTLVSATLATAGIMDLPVFGLGHRDASTTTETAGLGEESPSSTGSTNPEIVEQVVYEDIYERVPRPARAVAPTADDVSTTTAAPQPPPTTSAITTSAPPPAPTTSRPATTVTSPTSTRSATTTRPAPPPGCKEPEWDREHQRWHCKGD